MEGHMAPLDTAGAGSSSVVVVPDSTAADLDLDLRVLCDRVKLLEQNASSVNPSDSYLRNRIRELERSERTLLQQLSQLAVTSHLHSPSMQHTQRLDQRLHVLREEVRTMTQENERGERVWRDRLQRCQNQLKAKEEEMGRQSQYFQNFKTQLQHKLSLARDREQSLQNRVHALEKQLLDLTVSAATNMATITAVSITAGSVLRREETDRLPCLRGEGEGEEEGEKKDERKRRQRQQRPGCRRGGGNKGEEGETEDEKEGEGEKDAGQSIHEAKLQGFILSLQEDLRALLEREEKGVAERRLLTEQLQGAQENSHFLGCEVEQMKAEVCRLKLSESSLTEEAEELREENQRLHRSLREAANQTPSQSFTIPGSTCTSPGPSSPGPSSAPSSMPFSSLSNSNATKHYSAGSSGKVHLPLDELTGQPHLAAHPPLHHQGAAENTQNHTEADSSSVKSETAPLPKPDLLNLSAHLSSNPNPNSSLQSLALSTDTVEVGEFNLGNWCSRGALNLEESPSEEADALREAYRSLGLGEDLEALRQQRDRLEATLQHTKEQLQSLAQENARLKLQLRKQAEEQEAKTGLGSSREKINKGPTQNTSSTHDGIDHIPSSLTQDNAILTLTQNGLAQALNQENRALADRIQELLAHIELREGESIRELAHLREQVSRLEADGARLEQENQEQGCLIIELTKKTEDDLNTIMDLQQRLMESGQSMEESQGYHQIPDSEMRGPQLQSDKMVANMGPGSDQQHNLEGFVDSLVDNLLQGEEEPESVSSQQVDHFTRNSALCSQEVDNDDSPFNTQQGNQHVSLLTGQIDQLAKSVQNLKQQQEELTGSISALREEQREVAMSVQTQTEEKQQLTRLLWGLKEERDRVAQSLSDLKQERDQLSRTVCGLRDEKGQFIRSMTGLKEEKEQLTNLLSELKEEREGEKDKRDQIKQSLQSLQKERDQLSQAVHNLNQERDELTDSLECLKERRDQDQSCYASKEERDKLMRSVCSLKEEKERTEHLITGMKQEEKQIMLSLQGLREEICNLQAETVTLHNQSQTDGRSQRPHLSYQNHAGMAKKTEALATGAGDCAAVTNQTTVYIGKFAQGGLDGNQDQSDLMREIEALGAELRKSREELLKAQSETQRLYSELCQSETRREESEKKAGQAANEVMRMMDVTNQMEETTKKNNGLTTQVKELQSRLSALARDKADVLSVKTQMEEQFTLLQAQLKAKTVALQELSSEYTALKTEQGSRDEMNTTLISLRTRYSDIRAKYDLLLKKKSQTDLDIAPLKAKLSCLVVKCQERNSLLFQMMRAMRRQGCADFTLTQQAEHLLSDTTLQDYAARFTPGAVESHYRTSGFTSGFVLELQDYTSGFPSDQSYIPEFPPVIKHQEYQNGLTPGPGVKDRKEHTCGNYVSAVTPGSATNPQDCSDEFTHAPTAALNENAKSPVPTSPFQEHANVPTPPSPAAPALKENSGHLPVASSKTSPPPSASGPVQAHSVLERFGPYHPVVTGESTSGPGSFPDGCGKSLSLASPSPDRCTSLSRRLSSPEKIINLHQELQKTLSSSYQAPVRRGSVDIQVGGRGRGQQPRRSLSDLAAAELNLASPTKNKTLTDNIPNTTPLLITTAPSQAKRIQINTVEPMTTNTSTTLYTAVASRSANVTVNPSKLTRTLSKAAIDTTTTSTLSSSFISPVTTVAPSKSKPSLSSNAHTVATPGIPISPKQTTIPVLSDAAKHTAPTTLTPRITTSISNTVSPAATVPTVRLCTGASPNNTASDNTAPRISAACKANITKMTPIIIGALDGAAPVYDGMMACPKSAPRTPERSSKLVNKSTAPPLNARTARPKPEAPAEVGSVEVIRTVGQSSLMIGWERPPLDELGCSNGTFVYGYRVYVDGDFHKSVMSSACTKCILENVDLSVPGHISVQTLGSNGLSSNRVDTMYRTSVRADRASFRTDHRPSSCTDSQPASSSGYNTLHSHRQSGLTSQQSAGSSSQSKPTSPVANDRMALQRMDIYSNRPLRDSRELALREGGHCHSARQPSP